MSVYGIKGIKLATAAAGIRYEGRDDLLVIDAQEGSSVVAVFTQNKFSAAPVQVAKSHLSSVIPRALLINSGNANAGTGTQGINSAIQCCEFLAQELSCDSSEILPFSTGVIGEQLATDVFTAAIPACVERLSEDASAWELAAKAIMTTDTVPKLYSRKFIVDGCLVHITGIAKGAGMIRPNMATMLSYIATDAAINTEALQKILTTAVSNSFNRITVDGDTSTNDACVLMASGAVDMPEVGLQSPAYEQISDEISGLMLDLAQSIIRDAEGATKFITIKVNGGLTEDDCSAVAYTVAESPLVKTALFASDPNWGRILAAVGRAPVDELNISEVSIKLNGVAIVTAGEPDVDYSEESGQHAVSLPEVLIEINIGNSAKTVTVWTSDLSHEYVRINAEYRT